jgi:hypothetical protein
VPGHHVETVQGHCILPTQISLLSFLTVLIGFKCCRYQLLQHVIVPDGEICYTVCCDFFLELAFKSHLVMKPLPLYPGKLTTGVRTLIQYQTLRDSSEMNVFCSFMKNIFEPFLLLNKL